jgi:ABC-2 type transport system ATP-binding protein
MLIKVRGIKKTYKKGFALIKALDGVDLSVDSGKIVGILGPNGAGKTTLLKIITGITTQNMGSVEVFGEKDLKRIHKRIGFLPENPSFFRNITAYELLAFSLSIVEKGVNEGRIDHILKLVDLSENKNRKVKSFSKGMVQRLGIAQAVIHNPDIYIFDEPMSGLDPIGRKMVKDIILSSKKKGKTVLFSTHNLDDIENLCDEVIMIKSGKVVLNKKISELRNSNSYGFEVLNNGKRESMLIKGNDDFWKILEEIKESGKKIISIRSDISEELEKYYEK